MNHELITPNRTETVWGIRYILFQLIFLGSFLDLAARLLGIALTAATLNAAYFAVNFLVAVVLCRKFLQQSMKRGIQDLGNCLGLALGGFGVVQASTLLLGFLIALLNPGFSNVNDSAISNISQGNMALMTVGTVLLVPLTEEVFYRGIVFGGLYHRSRHAAYAVSVAVFALIHVSGYIGSADPLTLLLCFVQYLPAGFVLAFVYEKSGSLLPSVLVHTAVNAVGMLAMR